MKRRKPGYFSLMERTRGSLHTDQNNYQRNSVETVRHSTGLIKSDFL